MLEELNIILEKMGFKHGKQDVKIWSMVNTSAYLTAHLEGDYLYICGSIEDGEVVQKKLSVADLQIMTLKEKSNAIIETLDYVKTLILIGPSGENMEIDSGKS